MRAALEALTCMEESARSTRERHRVVRQSIHESTSVTGTTSTHISNQSSRPPTSSSYHPTTTIQRNTSHTTATNNPEDNVGFSIYVDETDGSRAGDVANNTEAVDNHWKDFGTNATRKCCYPNSFQKGLG